MQPQIFDRVSGTLEDITAFLDTIACPTFTYADVLSCYSHLVGRDWIAWTARPPPSVVLPPADSISEHSSSGSPPPARPPPGRTKVGLRWSPDEDAALVRGIHRYGWVHWKEIMATEPALAEGRDNRLLSSHAIWLQNCGHYGDLRSGRPS
jgi:hypothetical protein